jgi:hypothetical protein
MQARNRRAPQAGKTRPSAGRNGRQTKDCPPANFGGHRELCLARLETTLRAFWSWAGSDREGTQEFILRKSAAEAMLYSIQ